MGRWWKQIQDLRNLLRTPWEHDGNKFRTWETLWEPHGNMMSPFFEARYLVSEACESSHNWQIVRLSGLDIMQMHTFSLFLPSWSETGDGGLIHHSKDVQRKGLILFILWQKGFPRLKNWSQRVCSTVPNDNNDGESLFYFILFYFAWNKLCHFSKNKLGNFGFFFCKLD
jgi:hypothetical protein